MGRFQKGFYCKNWETYLIIVWLMSEINLQCNYIWNEKLLRIRDFKTCWGIREKRGSSFDKCDAAPRKWRHFKRPPLGIRQANCTLLSHPWTQVSLAQSEKPQEKRGIVHCVANDSRQVLLSKRQNMTPFLLFLQKKKRRIPSFLDDTMSDTFVVFPRFHIKIYRDKAKEEHISDRVHDKNCKL